jgi:hypothetical protein
MLIAEFMKQYAEENLAPKTVERYHEMATYIAPELLAMNLPEIKPLHLSREWTRLLKSGGREPVERVAPIPADHIVGLPALLAELEFVLSCSESFNSTSVM